MRRLLLVLAVMALLVLALAAPAFAINSGTQPKGPPSTSGAPHAAAGFVDHCEGGVRVENQNGSPHDNCF